MKTHLKFRLAGLVSILVVVTNKFYEYAPDLREDATMISGTMMICFGIAIRELQERK